MLTPQVTKVGWTDYAADKGGQLRTRGAISPDDPAQRDPPGDEDLAPWPPLPVRPVAAGPDAAEPAGPAPKPGEKIQPWYVVVLGALPARQAFERLDAAFEDFGDEDVGNEDKAQERTLEGHIVAASLVLDEWGVLVPDTLAIASFAWGLGHMLGGGDPAGLSGWPSREMDLKARVGGILTPLGADGHPRSLTWRDLRAASGSLTDELGLPDDLWLTAPCAIRVVNEYSPTPDILSSFFLADLGRVHQDADGLPDAAAGYLGLRPPAAPWNVLTDRPRLASLLQPGLFPLGRWPGPGLHPLTLLQQAAVNVVVRDLDRGGIAAVNGPPGTGKTTLLRDLVAHVVVSRAEVLAGLDKPWNNDLSGLDLMDFAIVAASYNNTAVENISRDLPIRAKALDESVWSEGGLDYFGHTANAVLGVAEDALPGDRAWGLVAARLGNAANRRAFVEGFWWNDDWGLNDWLDRIAWPNTPEAQRKPPGKLVQLDPPPRWPEVLAGWRTARDAFRRALDRCRQIREGLNALSAARSRLQEVEARRSAAERRLEMAELDLASAARAAADVRADHAAQGGQEATERAKLAALSSLAPPWWAKLLRTRGWKRHEAGLRDQVARLEAAQDAGRMAQARLAAAAAEEARRSVEQRAALDALGALSREADALASQLDLGSSEAGDALPGPGFWALPDDALLRAAPWNGGAFRAARDELFIAAMRLHRAFVVAAARRIKPSLHTVARSLGGNPDAPAPTSLDWGLFFLVVPVVSTTFASVGRMFHRFDPNSLGWLLIDEAGQATPQAAVGAIWRARRAIVIGDPLQIEPVVTTPPGTTQRIYAAHDADPKQWAAPEQSAQTLADRASPIQGRFRDDNGAPGQEERITGIPLLVHRRCEEPMFGIANRIAYAGQMVFATAEGGSPIRGVLGPSAWIDVDGPSTDKWVEAEGRLIADTLAHLYAALGRSPDLYVICPFRAPADKLRDLLRRTRSILPALAAQERRDWLKQRVGTVHTFQGKEAEAVILMLGAGRGAKAGSRSWAGERPNLLNVAATRAKRALYVVGNHAEWQGAGVFADAAQALERRPSGNWWPRASLVAE